MEEETLSQEFNDVEKAFRARKSGEPGSKERLVGQLEVTKRNLEGPQAYLDQIRLRPFLNMCIMIAIEMGLLNAVVARKGAPVTVQELSDETKQEDSLIMRILRELAVNDICKEVAPWTYCSNETAALLNTPAQSGSFRIFVDVGFSIGGNLVSQIRTSGIHPGEQSSFQSTYGSHWFDFLKSSPDHKKAFDDFMTGRKAGHRKSWFEIYPAAGKISNKHAPEAAMVVDIGGNVGGDLTDFRNRNRSVTGRLVNEDLPETFVRAGEPPEGVDYVAYNFFTMDQPVKGAGAYLLSHVLHDWSDHQARIILSSTAKAMKRGHSTLLIQDMVLPDFGAGWRHAAQDINMMLLVGGIERTLGQWQRLLDSAGLEIVKVWRENEISEAVIEAQLKET